jgi:hypothetical protein
MNAWYVAAVAVLALTVAVVVALPGDCHDALFRCDGIRVAPIVPLFVGGVLASLLGAIGFMRSTR